MPNFKRKLQREQYRATHPLLRFRKISDSMVNFVSDSLLPGTVVSVDSCPWALKISSDQVYELKTYQDLLDKDRSIVFLDSIQDLPQNQSYDNLLLCGITEFKYQPWQQAVNTVTKIGSGCSRRIIVALPITVLFFHRLKYNYHDIIQQINQTFAQQGWQCQQYLLDIDIAYFCLDKK